jgi:hypothetical protein
VGPAGCEQQPAAVGTRAQHRDSDHLHHRFILPWTGAAAGSGEDRLVPSAPAPFFLERTADRGRHNDALAAATGGRVGLDGVLDELGRTGRRARRMPLADVRAATAWAWDLRDQFSQRWWPQGITTSADAAAVGEAPGSGSTASKEEYAGRRVVLTSAYSKVVAGVGHGARISVVDVTDPRRVRYQNVLLVRAVADEDGLRLEPVRAHAGGLVWHGDHVHVAATAGGFHTFRLSDLVAVGGQDQPAILGPLPHGGFGGFGHRWVLPTRTTHAARTDEGARGFRYSWFSSVTTEGGSEGGSEGGGEPGRAALLAGEYAPPSGRGSTRLVEIPVDPLTGLPALDEAGRARPKVLGQGVVQAQGAVRVGGRLYVGTSNGRFRRGSVWVGPPAGGTVRRESFTRRPSTLPVGPEDLAYWPSCDEVWTVTEYPGRRLLVALDRSHLD